MIGDLDPEVTRRLVGVVDLADGRAVHAIAGNRAAYGAVRFCDGDPVELARYFQCLGLSSLYIADLDSIGGRGIQFDCLVRLLSFGFERYLVDVGWTTDADQSRWSPLRELARQFPKVSWVAATESCRDPNDIAALFNCVAPCPVVLGLDFRRGELCSHGPGEGDWIAMAMQSNCSGVIVLDVAAVGTGAGPATAAICQRIGALAPSLPLYSGGGIRTAQDIQTLTEAGCSGILIATALYPDRQLPDETR